MNKRIFCNFIIIFAICFTNIYAQKSNSSSPRQEKLLNGLKVLMWVRSNEPNVSVKIRIHNGSAFDPQNKEGVTKMLTSAIFPNEVAREVFRDDFGGSLEIIDSYDFIQINATSKPESFLDMIETLARAISNVQIDKELTAKLKTAQLEKLKENDKSLANIADLTVANRLLGTFPYGRTRLGNEQSIQKIDFADLIFARDRFLSADNATVTVTGNFNGDFAFRALRRNFGSWTKSDSKIPATFRQPDEPDTKLLPVTSSATGNTEIRYAIRGVARNDKDFPASQVLTKILYSRLQKTPNATNFIAKHEGHLLPGLVILGYQKTGDAVETQNFINPIINQRVSVKEFDKAKAEVLTEWNKKSLDDWWLDVDTFKLTSVSSENQALQNLTISDVQKFAEKSAKNPMVSVIVSPNSENK